MRKSYEYSWWVILIYGCTRTCGQKVIVMRIKFALLYAHIMYAEKLSSSLSPVMQKRFIFERGAGCGGDASGGVPVTGTLPDLGQSRSAGLRPPKWHFTAGTWAAHHDPRTIS